MPDRPLELDYSRREALPNVAPRSLLRSSQEVGWKNIQLVRFQVPASETPEIVNLQHVIFLADWKHTTEVELEFAGKRYRNEHQVNETGCIEILPANAPMSARWSHGGDFIHCYLEPTFLNHVAHEYVDPDNVEVALTLKKPDPLVWQIVSALKTVLETDPEDSSFYAEAMATALAAHFLRYYSTRKQVLREHEDGLPGYKLKQALDYINAHLSENVSLAEIATELGMSQYYFCRLFKQSTGITPHAYLIQQRIELSKQLLKQKESTVNDVAIACGFANPSHFARCFRRSTGVSPKQFRQM
ncbi:MULTISPECIES: AraC family transcriptional regulator [unclassified Leptolyngbya]|uniref:AraC family transcriptional regulator n=1 Tax=unclassified Leptolyngbya TaxID=2650499 RepID=UPI001688FED0|nr:MULTISPECIES: AraC family transcriptional regulator [unclassified Leptolyngbya]MBD1910285.1 helix-turn-helix transcriptional regulator [Leptolyngbya sp. FACHB-8]MBD2155803.1 helix-turn-helix transcriptional regulator [Leptolyngbya sp. FACHB-16]